MLFENTYSLDSETLFEYRMAVMKRAPLFKLFLLLAAAAMAGAVYNFAKNQCLFNAWLIIVVVLVVGSIVYGYRKGVKKNIQKSKEASGSQDPVLTIAIGENIEVAVEGSTEKQHFDFTELVFTVESKNLFVMMLYSGSGVILRKDSFISGNADDFSKFIKEKAKLV